MKPGDALIASLRRHDVLDGADARLVTWLRDHLPVAGGDGRVRQDEETEAFTLVAAALCRACASGSLCLPLAPAALASALAETLEAASGPSTSPASLPAQAATALPATPATGVRTIIDVFDVTNLEMIFDVTAVQDVARATAARFLAALGDESVSTGAAWSVFAGMIGTPDVPRPLIRAHDNLYLHRYWFAARSIADAMTARTALPPPAAPPVREAILRHTLGESRLRGPDGSPLDLTEGQRAALEAALSSSVFVLAGGPGTGKTTWTAAWLRALLRIPGVNADRVRLCAPTGRAARRLAESLRATLAGNLDDPHDAAAAALPVTTLHTLLGWRAFEGRFARDPGDPLDADWVLLDEASMADIFLLSALVRALKPGARLVLAGDPGQLPAVEAGAVLGELLPDPEDAPGPVPSVVLDVSHRATGRIIPLAAAVRRGLEDEVVRLLGPACPAAAPSAAFTTGPASALARIEPGDDAATDLRSLLHAFAEAAFTMTPAGTGETSARRPDAPAQTRQASPPDINDSPSYTTLLHRFRVAAREEETAVLNALWAIASRARVLAPLRRGLVSAERANRTLRERLEPVWRHPRDAHGPGFHGAPILVTRNDARTGLSNGDLGLWLEAGDGAMVCFPRPEHADGWLRIPVALLPACEPGFATTVHKSQGSECDEVLILLPEAGNRLLARETLYTAITRARKAVRVYGSEEAVREATRRTLRRPGGVRELFRPPARG